MNRQTCDGFTTFHCDKTRSLGLMEWKSNNQETITLPIHLSLRGWTTTTTPPITIFVHASTRDHAGWRSCPSLVIGRYVINP